MKVRLLDERFLGVAFLGGILILISTFVTWNPSANASAWDVYDVTIIASAVMVILGVILVKELEITSVGAMIPVGGLLALFTGIQTYRVYTDIGFNVGLGAWLAILGGILAIIGALGLGEKTLSWVRSKK